MGVGVYNSPTKPESGTFVEFWSFGVHNGAQTRGYGLHVLDMARVPIPPAQLVGRTTAVTNLDGSPRTNALHITGAAVKASCR